MKVRISSMLLVLVLVFAMSMNVMAAGTGTDAELVVSASEIDDAGQLLVSVGVVNGEGVTSGQITVSYDSALVELVSVSKSDAYRYSSVNDKVDGKVTLAWIASDLTADETQLLELTFQVGDDANGTAEFAASALKVYANGAVLNVKEAKASVEVGEGEEPTTEPTEPSDEPTEPSDEPTEPSDEPTEPSDEPTEPSDEPTEPSDEPTEPKEPAECPFEDISNHWANEEIEKVWAAELFNGLTETTFGPDENMNRAMFVTVLYRASGEPEVKEKSGFTDVEDSAYYADAVTWAVAMGITNGTSDTTFSPDKVLTRQEMVTLLYRYAESNGDDVSGRAAVAGFKDSAEIASWAKSAVRWAVKEGIINGYEDDTLRPNANTNRAQVAAVLCRYLDL